MFYCDAHNLIVLVKGMHSKYLTLLLSFGVIYLIVDLQPRTDDIARYLAVVNITESAVQYKLFPGSSNIGKNKT